MYLRKYVNHVNYEPGVGFQFQNLCWNPYDILLLPYVVNIYYLMHI